MIADFDDFVTWMYVLIDDIWQQIGHLYQRPGPEPACSDSELLTMANVGECREWDKETTLLGAWRTYPHLFPVEPERSRFNRRRRNLAAAINHIRQMVLAVLDLAQDKPCVIDSLPIEVVQVHLVPSSSGDWFAYGGILTALPSAPPIAAIQHGHPRVLAHLADLIALMFQLLALCSPRATPASTASRLPWAGDRRVGAWSPRPRVWLDRLLSPAQKAVIAAESAAARVACLTRTHVV